MDASSEQTGRVKWFNAAKGYGFIVPPEPDAPRDIFVHFSAIQMHGFRTLSEGEAVAYEPVETPKGRAALNVRRVEG